MGNQLLQELWSAAGQLAAHNPPCNAALAPIHPGRTSITELPVKRDLTCFNVTLTPLSPLTSFPGP